MLSVASIKFPKYKSSVQRVNEPEGEKRLQDADQSHHLAGAAAGGGGGDQPGRARQTGAGGFVAAGEKTRPCTKPWCPIFLCDWDCCSCNKFPPGSAAGLLGAGDTAGDCNCTCKLLDGELIATALSGLSESTNKLLY